MFVVPQLRAFMQHLRLGRLSSTRSTDTSVVAVDPQARMLYFLVVFSTALQ